MRKEVEEQAQKTFELLSKMNEHLNLKASIEIQRETEEEGVISVILDEWLSISVYWGEVRCTPPNVGGRIVTRECVQFDISEWKLEHNYPSEPDSVEETHIITHNTCYEAVLEAVYQYYKHQINQAMQSIEESKVNINSILDDEEND